MTIKAIGCCGAYCGTCRVIQEQKCKGCKLGYDSGERDINKARCMIKVCCVKKAFNSCADCPEILSCSILNDFFNKNGYKYKKYKEAVDFIRSNGYFKFLEIADSWTNVYGKYK